MISVETKYQKTPFLTIRIKRDFAKVPSFFILNDDETRHLKLVHTDI